MTIARLLQFSDEGVQNVLLAGVSHNAKASSRCSIEIRFKKSRDAICPRPVLIACHKTLIVKTLAFYKEFSKLLPDELFFMGAGNPIPDPAESDYSGYDYADNCKPTGRDSAGTPNREDSSDSRQGNNHYKIVRKMNELAQRCTPCGEQPTQHQGGVHTVALDWLKPVNYSGRPGWAYFIRPT